MVNIREPWPIDHILEKSTKHGESKMKQREMRKFFISAFSDLFPKFVCGTAVGIPYFAHCVINSCCPKRYIAVSLYITMSKEIDCMSTLMSPSGHSDPWAISKNKALLISDPIHITSSAKRIRPRDGRIYFAMSQLKKQSHPNQQNPTFFPLISQDNCKDIHSYHKDWKRQSWHICFNLQKWLLGLGGGITSTLKCR